MALADASVAVDRRPCHIVALPYPGRGHINPMLSLCRLLAARSSNSHRIAITVVLTEEWLGLLLEAAPPLPERVRLATIPNVIPSEHGRAADFSGFIEAVHTRMEAPVERLLRGMTAVPAAVVADMFLPWAVPMALRMGVAACSFCPSSANHFAAFYHLENLAAAHRATGRAGDSLTVTDMSDELWDQYIPGQTCIRLRDLEPTISQEFGQFMLRIRSVKAAQFVLFSTFYELEAGVIDSLMLVSLSPLVFPVGPCIPYMTLEEQTAMVAEDEYFTWLDSQPAGSVLYVSLGSFLSVSPSQLAELAMGLAASDVKFLWVLRSELQSLVLQLLADSNGILVPWCDQLKVLSLFSWGILDTLWHELYPGGCVCWGAPASTPPPQPKPASSPTTLTGRGAEPYDPKTNYTTPRPEFLRYDPERRREILLRVARAAEVEGDDCSSSASATAASEEDGGSVAPNAAAASPVSSVRGSDSETELEDSDDEEEVALPRLGRWARRLFLQFFCSSLWPAPSATCTV